MCISHTMAVNLSFVTHDEDVTARGAMERRSLLNFTKTFTEDIASPFSSSSTGQPYWDRRCSEAVVNRRSEAQVKRNLPKNTSSPIIVSSVASSLISDNPRSNSPRLRVRKKPVSEIDNPHSVILRQRIDNIDNSCCSDSEATSKPPKSPIIRSSASFTSKSENIRPISLPSHQDFTSGNHNAAVNTAYLAASSKDSSRPKSLNSASIDQSCGDSEHHQITSSRLDQANIPPKSRRDLLSVSDTVTDSSTPQDVKRAKPFFNISPSIQRRSPLVGRRKSPYKEFEIDRDCLDPESLRVVSHLPPKSPLGKSRTASPTNRRREKLERCASAEDLKPRKNKALSKHNKAPRRSIATDGWHPVTAMMTNYQYPGVYQDDDASDRNAGNEQRDNVDSRTNFDDAEFNILKVSPEEFAKQLTLLDLPGFVKIVPDEITTCGWTTKDKWKRSPNVCEMTQRFNNTSFWVIREILNASSLKMRVEIMTHFIKIAKKLLELNNLHSLMAVIQSLNSSSIIRLTKTWALVSKSNKATFDRLLNLVKIDGNRSELRAHMEGIKLPCIPFLGMYLSDLIYINSAHPSTGGMESQERSNKMNNILRVLSYLQQSCYDQLEEKPYIKSYLNSVKYIEELERFLEEDNYKQSLKIEPPPSVSTPEKKLPQPSKDEVAAGKSDGYPSKAISLTPASQDTFTVGHRKSRSLGKEYNFQSSGATRTKSDTSRNANANKSGSLPRGAVPIVTTSLLDDSIIATPSESSLHVSHSARHSLSMESNRSTSASDHSDPEDGTWSSQFSKRWSLPKNKPPTKWYKVYHGNRGKYSLRPVRPSTTPEEQRSSTYPIEKNSTLHSVYQSYINTAALKPGEQRLSPPTPASDLDECASLRERRIASIGRVNKNKTVYTSDDEIDDEEANLLKVENRTLSPMLSRMASKSQTDTVGKLYDSISSLSLQLTGAAKAWKQYFWSPVLSRRKFLESRSELNVSDPKMPDCPVGKAQSEQSRSGLASRVEALSEQSRSGLASCVEAVSVETSASETVDSQENCKYEGCVRRKCVLKNGKKPSVSPWTRYWLSLYGTTLFYFASKTITNKSERHHFKSHPCKSVSILGWTLLRSRDPGKQDSFQLSDSQTKTMYRFHCDSKEVAHIWMVMLEAATQGYPQPEKDLINLDDS